MVTAIVAIPTWSVSPSVLGSRLTLTFDGTVQVAILLVLSVWTGLRAMLTDRSSPVAMRTWQSTPLWMLPSLVAILGLLLQQRLTWWGYKTLLAIVAAVVFAVVVILQTRTAEEPPWPQSPGRIVLSAISYLIGIIYYIALYGSRTRSILSATGALVVSAMLAAGLLRARGLGTLRLWAYAMLIGICIGELTWALNYSSVEARVGGGFLLLMFYTMTGVTQAFLAQRLERRVIIEYSAVLAVGLVILSWVSRLVSS